MLAVRHYPHLVTPALRSWVREFVKYDDDGRGSCWLATTGKEVQSLPVMLANVADAVMPVVQFESVLLQSYRDGRAITPCHADAAGGFILSLGAPRTFRIHRVPFLPMGCGDRDLDAMTIECVEGTVLVMDAAFHAGWHHQIVADPKDVGEKLSLVFRSKA